MCQLWLFLSMPIDYSTYPIVVAITGGGPIRVAVDIAIGDGDAGVRIISAHNVLATNKGSLNGHVRGFARSSYRTVSSLL